jgi:ABC-type nitrate/sulfonate/bicarbonate transport system substrate-binding protein
MLERSRITGPGSRSRRLKAALTAAVSVTLLAACGGAGEAGETAGLGTVKVIQTNEHDLVMAGADVASHLGLWEDTLAVDIAVGEQIGQALATGDADVGLGSPNRVIGAIKQGLDATIVGPTIDWWDQYLVAATDRNADGPEDLKGATFGVTSFGSAGHFSTVKIAQELGWSESDYSVVTMGSLNGLTAGLQNGTIDAFMWSAFPAFTLEKEGRVDVVGSVRDLVGPNPLVVIAVRNEVIEERPEAVRAFCRGYYGASVALQQDPELTGRLFVQEWNQDPAVVPRVITEELPLLSKDGTLTDEMLENMVEAAKFTVEGTDDLTLDEMRGMYRNCSAL